MKTYKQGKEKSSLLQVAPLKRSQFENQSSGGKEKLIPRQAPEVSWYFQIRRASPFAFFMRTCYF